MHSATFISPIPNFPQHSKFFTLHLIRQYYHIHYSRNPTFYSPANVATQYQYIRPWNYNIIRDGKVKRLRGSALGG